MTHLTPLNQNAECTNLNEAIKRHNYISLAECIDHCESESQCTMIQYYDKLLAAADSRCYIFNQICHLSQDVGDRAETSHIYYKHQFSSTYCTDYPYFTDAYTDNCDAYVTYGFCSNGTTTDKATSDHFETAKNPIYGHTASEACCACGGGKRVFGGTAVSHVNEFNFEDSQPECDFDLDQAANSQYLAKWNNFALYELGENIVDNDLFVYSELLDVNASHRHTFIVCDYSLFLPNSTYSDSDTGFFIFAAIDRTQESLYFMNSKYFQLDLNVLSSNSELQQRPFEYCSATIANVSDTDILDVIIPCFTHNKTYTTDAPFSSDIPLSSESNDTEEGSDEMFLQKYLDYAKNKVKYFYPVDGDNWQNTAILGAGVFVFLLFCCICLRRCCCRKRRKKAKQDLENHVEDHVHQAAQNEDILLTLEGKKLLSNSNVSKETEPGTVTISTHHEIEHYQIDLHHEDLYDSSDESNVVVMDIEQAIAMGKETFFEAEVQQPRVHKKDKKKIATPYGILYEQTGFYDAEQMQNITLYFRDNPEKAPYLLFGDNITDKKRADGTKRQKSGNQSKVLGQYDRSIGFGIPTTFENAQDVNFFYTAHNYKKLLEYEFEKLKSHLLNGSDIVIPYPSKHDLSSRRDKYFNKKGKQVIHHNIGTGISNLPFGELCLIELLITELKKHASDVQRVHQVLYNDDDAIDDAYDDYINRSACGVLVFQFGWYSHDQMRHIHQKYNSKSKLKKAPKICFGDNDIDFNRDRNTARQYKGGQASAMAAYDRLFAYGIITTFFKRQLPIIGKFMHLMDKQFEPLKQHLLSGCDVVIPAPTKQDVKKNKSKYMMKRKQVIFHNIGTGIADLPFNYVQYIQTKITELQKYARGVQTVQYYAYSPHTVKAIQHKHRAQEPRISHIDKEDEIKVIYECPFCSKRVHYLMKFHNCNHSLCAGCLSDYVFRHLTYVDNNEQHRFQCWATSNGKCQGRICLQDVHYPKNRCKCEECLKLVTPTGNDTILDDESYRQFKNIMTAFSTRSKWDTDECPDCGRPFSIPRDWRNKQQLDENGYYYGKKQSFFADVAINPSECNCCGRSIENEFEHKSIGDIQGIMDEKDEEIADKDNNCHVCHHFYCDECRSNCFYQIEEYSTMRPPTPVAEARYEFNAELKLKQQDLVEYDDRHHHHPGHQRKKSSKHRMRYPFVAKFELCEICWYRFYCRKCPHCAYEFCGICDTQWKGCTANWLDKYKEKQIVLEEEEVKYDNEYIRKKIDEKAAHDKRSHHSCEKEKRKIEQKKKKEARSKESERKQKEKAQQRKISELEKQTKHLERRLTQKKTEYNKLKETAKHKEMDLVHQDKETQHRLLQAQKENERLQNEILRLRNGELVIKNDKLANKAHQTEVQRLQAINERDYIRKIADEEKKQKEDAINQFAEFRKKMVVIVWQWKENDGRWITYDDDISQAIEKLKVGETYTFKVNKNNQNYRVTRTQSDQGTQVNANTNVSRVIIRKQQERGHIVYPQWWNMEGLNMNSNDVSGGTGGAYSSPQLITMNLTDPKAQEVAKAFYNTSKNSQQYSQYYQNINIIKIESMQNQRLYDEFWSKRSIMRRDIGKSKLNERWLWHGTRTENVMNEIEYTGFRKEFNKTAMWGEGTYFAVNSGYSVGYSSNQNGVYKMFQCKVLCGESITGNRSYKLQTWPKKSNGKRLIYDSLVSTQGDIYVIHDDARAYPMFVVTFKIN